MSLNLTKIEWAKNPDGTPGHTWNPITGCLNHIDGLCKGGGFPCYAYRLANGRLRERYLANKNWDTKTPEGYEGYPNLDPFYPRFWEERLNELGRFDAPSKGIFVCDMGELFGGWIPKRWMREVWDCIKTYDNHRFYLLTKQPQNLAKFSPFPPNCYVGVTATNADMLMPSRLALGGIKAGIKYMSFEPLLSQMRHLDCLEVDIDWVIIGALTSKKHSELVPLHISTKLDIDKDFDGNQWTLRPQVEWVREIVEACDKAEVPVFLKDNLGWPRMTADGSAPFYKRDKTGTWILRQELPK